LRVPIDHSSHVAHFHQVGGFRGRVGTTDSSSSCKAFEASRRPKAKKAKHRRSCFSRVPRSRTVVLRPWPRVRDKRKAPNINKLLTHPLTIAIKNRAAFHPSLLLSSSSLVLGRSHSLKLTLVHLLDHAVPFIDVDMITRYIRLDVLRLLQ
jgi:hypothetical protein